MRIISFNVNSLRAICKKFDLSAQLIQYNPDIIMFQETKFSSEEDNPFYLENFENFINVSKIKKGYSGTMISTRIKPISVSYSLDGKYDDEGRIIILEFENFYLINSYTPNSKEDLSRIPYRMDYDLTLAQTMQKLSRTKPVILGGDLNVAPERIDLKNPDTNQTNAGFTIEERDSFKNILKISNTIDIFRYFHKDEVVYSWWSYRFSARAKNIGWRIDHFLISEILKNKVNQISYLNEILGSDHCPVLIDINL